MSSPQIFLPLNFTSLRDVLYPLLQVVSAHISPLCSTVINQVYNYAIKLATLLEMKKMGSSTRIDSGTALFLGAGSANG